MGLILLVSGVVVVLAVAASTDRQRYLESLSSPPPHIRAQARALDDKNLKEGGVQGTFHYYDRETKKEIIATDTHAVKVIS